MKILSLEYFNQFASNLTVSVVEKHYLVKADCYNYGHSRSIQNVIINPLLNLKIPKESPEFSHSFKKSKPDYFSIFHPTI